jgi:type 1 fimbria pilin
VSVVFAPQSTGSQSAGIAFSDALVNSPQMVSLIGMDVMPVALNTNTLAFGNQPRRVRSAIKIVTLSNVSSTEVLAISSVALSGDPDFAISGNSCGATLSPQTSCTVSLVFTPTGAGPGAATLTFTDNGAGSPQVVNVNGSGASAGDYDGDGKADIAIWRPSQGLWYIIPSSHPSNLITAKWGAAGDIPVPGDYDGDGKTDIAVWRPSQGLWYIIPSSHPSNLITAKWGAAGDIPVPGDYDGDGKTDIAVWRPSQGLWYIIPSSHPSNLITAQWGAAGDIPMSSR